MPAEPQTPAAPSAPPAERASVSDRLDQALTEAFKAEGIVKESPKSAFPSVESAEKPEEVKKEAAPPAEVKPPAPTETRLAKLARESAAARHAKENAPPLSNLDPGRAEALSKALAAKDPASALAALGFTHAQYEDAVVGRIRGDKTDKAPAPAPEGESDEFEGAPPKLVAEMKKMRATLQQVELERAHHLRTQTLANIGKQVESMAEKFPLVAKLGKTEAIESAITQYWREFQKLPGANFSETVEIMAEAIEADLQKEAERWRKALTLESSSPNVASTKASEPPSPSAEKRTESRSVPSESRKQSTSREDRIAALLKDPNFAP